MAEGWCVLKRPGCLALALTVASACAWQARAQPSPKAKGNVCREDIKATDGYKFRTTRVEARYLPAGLVTLPKPGTDYSPETRTNIQDAIFNALKSQDSPTIDGAIQAFKYVSSCV